MLKEEKILHHIITIIDKAVGEIVEKVFKDIKRDYGVIKGREEEITSAIRQAMNSQFIDLLGKHLNNLKIKNIDFRVSLFRKKQEVKNGSDIVLILEIRSGLRKIRKAIILQAKIGDKKKNGKKSKSKTKGKQKSEYKYVATNDDILDQSDKMLKHSSSSYFILYTEDGIVVIPATTVQLNGKNKLDTSVMHYHVFKDFIKEYFKCFIGDISLAEQYFSAKDFDEFAKAISVNNGVLIQVTKEISDTDKPTGNQI